MNSAHDMHRPHPVAEGTRRDGEVRVGTSALENVALNQERPNMRVLLCLIEAKPDDIWVNGEIKNVGATGSPTVTTAALRLRVSAEDGATFFTGPGLHAYRFEIRGKGEVKIQAFDADTLAPIAPPGTFDTTVVNGGHTYVFQVVA